MNLYQFVTDSSKDCFKNAAPRSLTDGCNNVLEIPVVVLIIFRSEN